jgi:putative oxidoreductase
MKFIAPIGRLLFSFIFIKSGFSHFKTQTMEHAASHGVIMPHIIVPIAGIMAILGGLSILLGFKIRIGGLLIVLFLIPVTLIMHNFWNISDQMQHQIQMAMFLKNTSMLGGALLIIYFGAGPMSLDENILQTTKK